MNPYSGLTLEELQTRRKYLLDVLNGENFESFGGQGANWKRVIPTLDEARQDLALVNAAIENLTTPQPTRTVFRAA